MQSNPTDNSISKEVSIPVSPFSNQTTPSSGQTSNGHKVTILSDEKKTCTYTSIIKISCLSLFCLAIGSSIFTAGAYTRAFLSSESYDLATNSSYISYKSSSTGMAPLPSSISASLTHSLSSTNQPLSNSLTSSSLFSSTASQNDFETNSQSFSSTGRDSSSQSSSIIGLSSSQSSSSTGTNITQSLSSSHSSSTGSSISSSSSSSAIVVPSVQLFTAASVTLVGTSPLSGPGTKMGTMTFFDWGSGNTKITWSFTSLAPYKTYGVHIYADNAVCLSRGDLDWYYLHFNPNSTNYHADRTDPNRHAGDLGNIVMGQYGFASGSLMLTKLQLSRQRSTNGIIGLIVVVEQAADDFVPLPGADIGPGLACGTITPA